MLSKSQAEVARVDCLSEEIGTIQSLKNAFDPNGRRQAWGSLRLSQSTRRIGKTLTRRLHTHWLLRFSSYGQEEDKTSIVETKQDGEESGVEAELEEELFTKLQHDLDFAHDSPRS